ncbi:hypothetical protein Glove_78g175 [Diversispora epigaea]|uniref:Uncharacterized protein n=1 Tax=Diversispora epigaea TaxID=1348612 RepID=A0A397JID2_9GLOM|nr:hypothetical protein Glove_78g175 [Diversispora epigaea]
MINNKTFSILNAVFVNMSTSAHVTNGISLDDPNFFTLDREWTLLCYFDKSVPISVLTNVMNTTDILVALLIYSATNMHPGID